MTVPAQNHQCPESLFVRALGIAKAVIQRVLAREERDNVGSPGIGSEIRHQVAKVFLFSSSDGIIGDKHMEPGHIQTTDRVVGVDPVVHALQAGRMGARGPQLRREKFFPFFQ